MLLVADVKKEKQMRMTEAEEKLWGIDKLNVLRSEIPAVTHVDYSARIQTVNKIDNHLYYDLINAFYKKTGCPVIVNTSFNVRGEPIVATPLDAYKCFMRTDIDVLVAGQFILQSKTSRRITTTFNGRKCMSWISDVRVEMRGLKRTPKELRKFAYLVGSVFILVGVPVSSNIGTFLLSRFCGVPG